jgi:hypothetical protein
MLGLSMPSRTAPLCAAVLSTVLLVSCGGGSDTPPGDHWEVLTGGDGPFIASAAGPELSHGYVTHEYAVSGTATDYRAESTLGTDGRWTFQPDTSADFSTRVLVRRPAEAAAMSGTVIVEWLNVSSGADADPLFTNLGDEILRQGHVWVGVSAQMVGVEGGEALLEMDEAMSLKEMDPERYDSLVHPGDGYSFDIFTQVAQALREGGSILGGARPSVIIAAGQSQSAFALTTYYNGVQPLAGAFDGFFIMSRAAGTLPLVDPGEAVLLTQVLFGSVEPLLRDDLEAPIMNLQAENDVIGFLDSYSVRQPDTDRYRLWEPAGTAHADAHLVGDMIDLLGCPGAVNNGPMHLVAKAALSGLDEWIRSGTPPPIADRLDVDQDGTALLRDDDGIALGGIRTPPLDVPVDVLSGEPGEGGSITCMLFGSTTPLSDERIAELYDSRADYETKYEASANTTIGAGFVLETDRSALLDYAQPDRVEP